MSYTRRQYVEGAYEELGMANYVFDLTPEMLQSACRRLDNMMALWNSRGVRLGYPLPGSPENTELDTETGVAGAANQAIITNLSLLLAPTVGKTPSVETKVAAKASYDSLLAWLAVPRPYQLPVMPSGAGNKNWERPFTTVPIQPVLAGQDGPITFD